MFRLTVDDVFFIRGRGTVVTGKVADGVVRVGDQVRVGDRHVVRVDGIEAFRKTLDQAQAGLNIGLLLRELDRSDVKRGDVIASIDTVAGLAQEAALPADPTGAPSPIGAGPAGSGRDPRFDQAEAQRTQLLSMRSAGLMDDRQVDEGLRELTFEHAGRRWQLGSDGGWSCSDGSEFRPATPPE